MKSRLVHGFKKTGSSGCLFRTVYLLIPEADIAAAEVRDHVRSQ